MIGPTLPPNLQKKTEKPNTDERLENTDTSSTRPTVTGPQLPPHLLAAREAKRKRKREEELNESSNEPTSPPPKRATEPPRPSPPPPTSHSDSESDDEVGPSVAIMMTPQESAEYTRKQAIERLSRSSLDPESNKTSSEPKLQRDSWMLAPPTRADWLGSLDASKLKSRTFNQSKSGTNTSAKPVDSTIWTESPLERAQRLEDEALGRKSTKPAAVKEAGKKIEDVERDRRIKEFNKQTRGPSLMEQYSTTRKVEDDDPSKRAFDYQKDIAGGQTLGFKERNAMINRAKDLDSKYSGGSYL
jgi:hypothetical protein